MIPTEGAVLSLLNDAFAMLTTHSERRCRWHWTWTQQWLHSGGHDRTGSEAEVLPGALYPGWGGWVGRGVKKPFTFIRCIYIFCAGESLKYMAVSLGKLRTHFEMASTAHQAKKAVESLVAFCLGVHLGLTIVYGKASMQHFR